MKMKVKVNRIIFRMTVLHNLRQGRMKPWWKAPVYQQDGQAGLPEHKGWLMSRSAVTGVV